MGIQVFQVKRNFSPQLLDTLFSIKNKERGDGIVNTTQSVNRAPQSSSPLKYHEKPK